LGATFGEHHGRLWEVAPWLPGTPDLGLPPTVRHIQNAFRGLAAFHQRLAAEATHAVSPGLNERLDSIRRLAGGGFGELEQAIDRSPHSADREALLGRRWIALARRVASDLARAIDPVATRQVPLQPALRDTRAAHFLFVDDDLTGLVDYGAMGIESVAADLGRLIGDWLGDDRESRQLALDSYDRVRPLATLESSLIPAFIAGTSFLIGERWIRWHFLEGRRFDDPSAVAGGIARSIDFLEKRLFNP
jgi:homoserine kinase type II